MLMTVAERKAFKEQCVFLGVKPFDALGYKEGDLFSVHFEGLAWPKDGVKLVSVSDIDSSMAWFESESGSNFLAYFNEVTPYDPGRVPEPASDMSVIGG